MRHGHLRFLVTFIWFISLFSIFWLSWTSSNVIDYRFDPLFATHANTDQLFDLARALIQRGKYRGCIQLHQQFLYIGKEDRDPRKAAAAMHDLVHAHLALSELAAAREWVEKYYTETKAEDAWRVEPAYMLCRALRERGDHALAYYYYLKAKGLPVLSAASVTSSYIPLQPDIYDYLLDYEKSVLWFYIGGIEERHSRLHGLGLSMRLLTNPRLPQSLRSSVFNNLQFYVSHVGGSLSILRAENSIAEEWRYSTPTFIDKNTTLIRVVNYFVSEDGSYHVASKAGGHVNTQLVLADTDKAFRVQLYPDFERRAIREGLLHPDAYILGLEDTRAVRDRTDNETIYTLSASEQFSNDGRTMNQVLGVLDLATMTHTVHHVIKGPNPDHHDKNWVFAGGLRNVVYGWYPSIDIGNVNVANASLDIHTSISSPRSFEGMRGSTNGVFYQNEWWFVTHAVIYRPGQMRKYLHFVVVLDSQFTRVVRYSFPFTFEDRSDVEYCLGFTVETFGLTFGYSVRDRSSRVVQVGWRAIGELFNRS